MLMKLDSYKNKGISSEKTYHGLIFLKAVARVSNSYHAKDEAYLSK